MRAVAAAERTTCCCLHEARPAVRSAAILHVPRYDSHNSEQQYAAATVQCKVQSILQSLYTHPE
jgi:hypothetical protein